MVEKMYKKGLGHFVAKGLLIVGGLNWLTIGITNYNFVSSWFGSVPMLPQVIYISVGISALYLLLAGLWHWFTK